MRKSLRIFVQVSLLGLLLGTWSTAYADALSFSSLSFSNFQITPAAGAIVLVPAGTRVFARATNSLGEAAESNPPGATQASASVTFAGASAVLNTFDSSASSRSQVDLAGCTCDAFSVGQAGFTTTFIIMGGNGNVDVTVSALLMSMQKVMTDQLGISAESEVNFGFDLNGTEIFSFDSRISIGPNSLHEEEVERQLSQVLALQFNTQYTFVVTLSARSEASNMAPEIPEPATIVLLVSGLGLMTRFMKKRRNRL